MYIRKTTQKLKGKIYTNYLLVKSVATKKGPRQKSICSLGNLKPRPREEWLKLVQKVESALSSGQKPLFRADPDTMVQTIVAKAEHHQGRQASPNGHMVEIMPDKIRIEKSREIGPVHVGLQIYNRLGIGDILSKLGFSAGTLRLTLMMVLNRLILPKSEHAMRDWIVQSGLSDILECGESEINDDKLYRNLDRLYPLREQIEGELSRRESDLFSMDESVYLYDLTSTYFEGKMENNPQAKRGYSRDHRPDCKQLVIGMVFNREGFPRAHEVFDGNRIDCTTVEEMLGALEKRVGLKKEALVVVDRGMAFDDNLKSIKKRGYHYLVACRQAERNQWLAEYEDYDGWEDIEREVSATNPEQVKTRVQIKRVIKEEETMVLCISDGRREKDRAIREKQEKKLLLDLQKLEKRIRAGKLKTVGAIHQAIGRLRERYPRVMRYYEVEFDLEKTELRWQEKKELKKRAEELDGAYLLKTDKPGITGEEIWRNYILLTRAESAFRDMKSPLLERPIYHQLEHRAQAHIFLCVLAYHLLVAIEHQLRCRGDYRSWETIREILKTHQVATVVLPTSSGEELHIRRGTVPEPQHVEIYDNLGIPHEPMKPVKKWQTHAENSD